MTMTAQMNMLKETEGRYKPSYQPQEQKQIPERYSPISFRETFKPVKGGAVLNDGILAIRAAGSGEALYSSKTMPLTSKQIVRKAMDIKNRGVLILVETAEGHKRMLTVDADIAARI